MAPTPTAGLRNAAWSMNGLPDGTAVSVQSLRTHDNAACTGFFYWRGKPETAVCIMHPREFMATHCLALGARLQIVATLDLAARAAGSSCPRGRAGRCLISIGASEEIRWRAELFGARL